MKTSNNNPIILNKQQPEIKKIDQKSYINSKLLKYTREFTDEEVAQWLKNDSLVLATNKT